MIIGLSIIAIFAISFFLAFRSMGDFEIPGEIDQWLSLKRIRGSIVFFKQKIKHYHHH